MDNGQNRPAIACLKRMTTVDPENVSGWQNLAVAQFMRGQYEPGIESCEEALKRDPDNLPTIFNLALAYENVRRYGRALHWVRRGLEIDPRDLAFQKLEFRLRVMGVLHRAGQVCDESAVLERALILRLGRATWVSTPSLRTYNPISNNPSTNGPSRRCRIGFNPRVSNPRANSCPNAQPPPTDNLISSVGFHRKPPSARCSCRNRR